MCWLSSIWWRIGYFDNVDYIISVINTWEYFMIELGMIYKVTRHITAIAFDFSYHKRFWIQFLASFESEFSDQVSMAIFVLSWLLTLCLVDQRNLCIWSWILLTPVLSIYLHLSLHQWYTIWYQMLWSNERLLGIGFCQKEWCWT